MRLIKLSANSSAFRTIHFRPNGLTLILGSASDRDDASSNGVGKSLALQLVHHCLGASAYRKLGEVLPEWEFRLVFEMNGTEHLVERSSDGKNITFDEQSISLSKLRRFLNDEGPFSLPTEESVPALSFRSLFKRFARLTQDDCHRPEATARQNPYDALVASLFLLGLDIDLAVQKYRHKREIDQLEKAKKIWRDTPGLRELFRAGNDARVRADWLRETIPSLREDLDALVVAENYEEIEEQANKKTTELRGIEKDIEILKFQVKGINEQLQRPADIDREKLLELYKGMEQVFKSEALQHFEAVAEFHESLADRRERRLSAERARIRSQIEELEGRRRSVATDRDNLLKRLQGKTAFEEYRSVANDLAAKEQELHALQEYLDLESNVEKEILGIRDSMLREAHVAHDYIASNPLASLEKKYRELTKKLFPQAASGISLENNVDENTLRYNLKVHLEAANSDGVRDAMIICFDWLVYMHGANHSMHFLWHDNRLFAHLDPGVRARWFSHVQSAMEGLDKQYIASMNFENFDSMKELMNDEEVDRIRESVAVELHGDKVTGKLLGVQVDI